MSDLGTQIMISAIRPAEDLVDPVANSPRRNKPEGGMWTSTETLPGCSEWTDVAGYGADAWRLEMDDSRVYELDSHEAARELARRYPAPAPANELDARMRETGLGAVDWTKVAKDYDCVHFTPYRDVLSHKDCDLTYGWDIESTWHARWNFTDLEMVMDDHDHEVENPRPADRWREGLSDIDLAGLDDLPH